MILLSSSNVKMSDGKTVSTGFKPKILHSLEDVALLWQRESISSAVYSNMYRFTHGEFKWDYRRRIHNISMIGNAFIYDFDSGELSMRDFCDTYVGQFQFLAIKSRNDHKYEYDRFKVLVLHNCMFTHTLNDDVPEGFERLGLDQYKQMYIGFAEHFKFWQFADQSTIDLSRLCASVGEEYLVCSI